MSKALECAHHARMQALLTGDFDTLANYVSEDLIYCSPHGKISYRPEVFAGFISGAVKVERMDVSETETRQYGKTGIISYQTSYRMTDNGELIDAVLRSTAVYIEFEDGWKLVSQQQTPVV